LTNGCLQEEIKFITCPELLLAKLFPGHMKDNEAILVSGAHQYVEHQNYGEHFKCIGGLYTPRDNGRAPVIAIDAFDFSAKQHDGSPLKPSDQFQRKYVERELLKAYAGFSAVPSEYDTIATGNWGGGCFKVFIILISLFLKFAFCCKNNCTFCINSFVLKLSTKNM